MKRAVALGFAVALNIGCASAPSIGAVTAACPEGELRTLSGDTTRPVSPPVPRGMFLPPMPPPTDVRDHRMEARLVVDATGRPMRDSITVCGIPNPAYTREVVKALARMPFEPARRDDVAITAPVLIAFDFR